MRSKNAPEIAGDLVVAMRPNNQSFVQFTKTPLPLVSGQATARAWQIKDIPQNKTHSGHGKPPLRALLLWLPRALAGETLPKALQWHQTADGNWHLENRKTGESLEGFLSP